MNLRHSFCVLMLFSLSLCNTLEAQDNTYFIHTVSKGQTLYSIANMYRVRRADIVALNPGSERSVAIGQKLRIPQMSQQRENFSDAANVGNTASVPSRSDVFCFHTIKPGETLYRLTVIYRLTAKEICDANPGLSVQNFKAGQVVAIPKGAAADIVVSPVKEDTAAVTGENTTKSEKIECKTIHKVVRGETVYSVTHLYDITEEELFEANPALKKNGKLKKKTLLCIPYSKAEMVRQEERKRELAVVPTDRELFENNKPNHEEPAPSMLKVAVVLPFMLGEMQSEEQKRMVEFYEGFLMAVDSLKSLGCSMELFVYDSGDEERSLGDLLSKEEMKGMNIIFGPPSLKQTNELAKFARENDVRLILPFTSKGEAVFSNPKVYQVHTLQSYFYPEVYDHFVQYFPKAHVVFVGDSIEDGKVGFINGFKAELNRKNISFTSLSLSEEDDGTIDRWKMVLKEGKSNIFVPLSGSLAMLNRVLPSLQLLARNDTVTSVTDFHLFGYPEWQIHAGDRLSEFYEIDTYFYTAFYTNNLLPNSIKFANDYYRLYSKEMINNFPKYAMLGFDVGHFFLLSLYRNGESMDENINRLSVQPIQTGFQFERDNFWSGFINKKVFFVHFSRDYQLRKIDFDR